MNNELDLFSPEEKLELSDVSAPWSFDNQISKMSALPFEEHFVLHFLKIKGLRSEHTKKNYEVDIRQFFSVAAIEDITIEMIKMVNIFHCEQWIMHMTKQGLKSATIHRKISSLSALYNWLLRYKDNASGSELIKYNPFSSLRDEKPKINHKETAFLTQDEVKKILNTIPLDTLTHMRNRLMISLLVTTALRKSELLGIKLRDLKTHGNFYIIEIMGKGQKKDSVKLQVQVKQLLDYYLYHRQQETPLKQDDYLFVGHCRGQNARKLHPSTVNEIVTDLCKKSGIEKNVTVHSLRHTAITLSILNGTSIEKVRDFARHANIATTNRYIHSINKFEDYAGDQINIFDE